MSNVLDYLAQVAYGVVAANQPVSSGIGLLPTNALLSGLEIRDLQRRTSRYLLYEGYYLGQQRDITDLDITQADDSTRISGDGFVGRHNFCDTVIDATVERLTVRGFEVTGGPDMPPERSAAIAAQLWAWWQGNRMDVTAPTVHAQALIKGDAYVVVDYDPVRGMPTFTGNDAAVIVPTYDAQHTLLCVYKLWTQVYFDDAGELRSLNRLTEYFPGLIRKYAQQQGKWEPYPYDLDSAGQPDGGQIAWVDGNGQPIGIPIIHFKNRPRGADFGVSDLADLLPLQDEFNRRVIATSLGIAYAGNSQKYVIDATPPVDERGERTTFVAGPGTVFEIHSEGESGKATVGQLPATDVGALQDATDRQLKLIAAKSRTPLHLLWPEGALPSGESLKTAEAGLVAKCKDRAAVLGNAWEDALVMALRLVNVFGPPELAIPEAVTLETQWESFESRSALLDEQVIALRRSDISWQEAMRQRGYDADAIAQIEQEMTERGSGAPGNEALQMADQFAASLAGQGAA